MMFHNEDPLAIWEQKAVSRAARLSNQPGAAPTHGSQPENGAGSVRQPVHPQRRIELAGRKALGKHKAATLEQRLVTLFFD